MWRMLVEAAFQGAAALRANPLRAGLGALAIAVAVATIILVVSVLVHAAGNGRAALAAPRKREKAGSEDPAFSTTRARGGT